MIESELHVKVIEQAGVIAKILAKGDKDVEIRKSKNGVSVAEISKKVIKM